MGLAAASTAASAALLTPSRVLAAPKPILDKRFRLVIDPGHGGENEGCHGHDHGVVEKELTLVMAQQLATRVHELLPRAEILLTREADETLHLSQRVAFANAAEADLFLSLHCNASPLSNQTGYETFILDLEASNEETALTAQRENDEGFARPANTSSEGDVSTMLRELSMTADRSRAAHFARAIQTQQRKLFPDRPDRGVRQGPFDVLMGARMPAVLHEVGFLDHPGEGPMLRSESGQAKLVEAIAQATASYYGDIVRRA